jgi:hypothetical protein
MLRCCRCGETRAATEFNWKHHASGRRQPFCRDRQHAGNREHYQRNRATYVATARRHNAEHSSANVKRVIKYLRQHPCVDCGESDILVLRFDHPNGADKVIAVGPLLSRYSGWPQLMAEISKCDVRCQLSPAPHGKAVRLAQVRAER